MERWVGRTALVTGASTGIGFAISVELLKNGVNVVACARRVDKVEQIKEEAGETATGKLLAIQCDVSKEEEILAMFEQIKNSEFQGVDICVNNAAFGHAGKLIDDGHSEAWRNMLMVNILGLSICTRETINSMKERGVDDGHIINMSGMASQKIYVQVPFYCATKHAILGLTEGLRQELAERKSGIRVTQIDPDLTKTDFITTAGVPREMADAYFAMNPHLNVTDVVSTVMYALSTPKHVQIHDILVYPISVEN